MPLGLGRCLGVRAVPFGAAEHERRPLARAGDDDVEASRGAGGMEERPALAVRPRRHPHLGHFPWPPRLYEDAAGDPRGEAEEGEHEARGEQGEGGEYRHGEHDVLQGIGHRRVDEGG